MAREEVMGLLSEALLDKERLIRLAEKNMEIARLKKALAECAAARMPGEARRIAFAALADQPKGEG